MTFEQQRRLVTGPLAIEFTQEEMLADLCWPGPPPGQWLDMAEEAGPVEARFAQIGREAA